MPGLPVPAQFQPLDIPVVGSMLQGGFGNDNKMEAVGIQVVFQVGEEGNGLESFTIKHRVSQ